MNTHVTSQQGLPPSGQARDLQARLYREIGISAVAAALRFTTMPDPVSRPASADPARLVARRGSLAA